MSEAKIDFVGMDKNVVALIQSISTGFDRMAASQERVEEASKRSAKASEDMFNKMGSGLANQIKGISALTTSWLSVDGAIRLATASYERYKDQAKASAEFGSSYAGARSAALLNAPTTMNAARFDALIDKASKLSGGRDRVALAQAFGPTFSSGSTITPEQQAEFIGLAGRLTIGSDEEMKALAKTGVMVGETLGTTDAADALGFVMSGQGNSITSNLNQYGKAATPVLSAAKSLKFDPRWALASMNALQKAAGDEEGSSTATNFISMMTQLSQLREPLGLGEDASGEAIYAALQDPKNAEILGNLISYTASDRFQGEKKFGAGMRSLVTGGDTRREYDSLMGRIVALDQGDQYTDAKLRQLGGDTNVASYRMMQGLVSAAQRNNADPREVERGLLRQGLEAYVQSDRTRGVINAAFEGLSYDALTATGGDPSDIVIEKLAKQERKLRAGTTVGGFGFGGVGHVTTQPATREELASADEIAEVIKFLRSIDEGIRDVRASNQTMANAETKPTPNGPPPLTSGVKQ